MASITFLHHDCCGFWPSGCSPLLNAAAGPSPRNRRAGNSGSTLLSAVCASAPLLSPPEKPKLSREERQARYPDRLTTIRLRMAIGRELDERDITTPAAIGEALGMPAAEATSLLTRHQWREGDVARLEAAAARLGVQVPPMTGI